MATAAQQFRPEDKSGNGLGNKLGWLGLTLLIGLLISLLSSAAADMRAADKRNEQDIRILEQRLGRLEGGIERLETKLDLLVERGRRK